MRQRIFFIIALSLIVFFPGCAKTVAIVNGQGVTQKELDQELEKAGGKNMLDTLIGRKLVEQDASTKGVSVSSQEVDEQLNDLKKTFSPADQQSLNGDKLKMLRDEIQFQILLQKSIMAKVPDSEIKNYYDKNKDVLPEAELGVIVVGDVKQANAIEDEIHRGKDFAGMASQFSLDPNGRQRGGYVGYLSRGSLGQLSPQLAAAAFSVKSGETTPVIKTPKGYYIIKVLNKRTTYEELKNEVERQMAAERVKTYIDDLHTKAKIDYKGEYAKR